ncbi:MAG: FAD-dependent oxidoreductase [Microcystaceae cyanobacterium]
MKNLVLVGGGHSHAIVLKLWSMNPLNGVRLILLSDVTQTPYSGMLPAYVSGFYTYEQTHINLPHLTQLAKADFKLAKAVDIDIDNQQVICNNNVKLSFDVLSIDIGSTPTFASIKGDQSIIIPAKPVPQFLAAWHKILDNITNNLQESVIITIIGGGAGGIELALNMQSRLSSFIPNKDFTINLIHKGSVLLKSHNYRAGYLLKNTLIAKGINLFLQEEVIKIAPNNQVICQSGLTLKSDYIFGVTQATAPNWLKSSQISTDKKGFILVKDTLQSLSHSNIFAAGDIATMVNFNCPKAGVFAVRQGKPLFNNLQNFILNRPLNNYCPQKNYLALIGTGDRQAVAAWWKLAWKSPLLWQWKDRIDRQFMEQFR